MANGYKICIPARLESSRLEQKLLCNVNGKTIIQRTWERCLESSADTVTVITDSTEIFDLISDLGGDCFLSQSVHESGTDRLAEAGHQCLCNEAAYIHTGIKIFYHILK